MFPAWTWIVGFIFGAFVGSFLNAAIYRLPRGLSMWKPRWSFCPSCDHRLGLLDLFPILSWAFLGGKCRHCKAPIGPRYMIVELITATLWGLIFWQHLVLAEDPVVALGYAFFASALVAAIFTDLQHYIIPDQINAVMLFVGLMMNVGFYVIEDPRAWMWGMPSSIAGALLGWGILWGIAFLGRLLFRKDAMGHGDIKMVRGIGAVLLPLLTLISIGIAVFLGAVLGLILIAAFRNRASHTAGPEDDDENYEPESIGSLLKCGLGYLLCIDVIGLFFPKLYEWWFAENPYAAEDFEEAPEVDFTQIPFGPYLAAGALAAVFFGEPLAAFAASYWEGVTGGEGTVEQVTQSFYLRGWRSG